MELRPFKQSCAWPVLSLKLLSMIHCPPAPCILGPVGGWFECSHASTYSSTIAQRTMTKEKNEQQVMFVIASTFPQSPLDFVSCQPPMTMASTNMFSMNALA